MASFIINLYTLHIRCLSYCPIDVRRYHNWGNLYNKAFNLGLVDNVRKLVIIFFDSSTDRLLSGNKTFLSEKAKLLRAVTVGYPPWPL